MLKKHMLKRIKELGGLNPLSVRIVSLEKWLTIDQFIRKGKTSSLIPHSLQFKRGHGIHSDTCGMCRLYYKKGTTENYWLSSCSNKCLFKKNKVDCDHEASLWRKAQDAIRMGDLEIFQRIQAKMVSKLRRSIAQLQKTN